MIQLNLEFKNKLVSVSRKINKNWNSNNKRE